jgi:hypothetical protein
MKIIAIIQRVLLGAIFLISGINGFVRFSPVPSFGLRWRANTWRSCKRLHTDMCSSGFSNFAVHIAFDWLSHEQA